MKKSKNELEKIRKMSGFVFALEGGFSEAAFRKL